MQVSESDARRVASQPAGYTALCQHKHEYSRLCHSRIEFVISADSLLL